MRIGKRLLNSDVHLPPDSNYTHFLIVFLVLASGLIATVYFWDSSHARVSSDITTKYQRQISLIESLITLRLQQYSNILNGGAGLLTINHDVTQAEWDSFYQAYNFKQNYAGIDAVSFSKYVTNANLPDYLSAMVQNDPNFAISPSGMRNNYAPVTFVAAISPVSLKSIGYDPLSDSIRSEAMLKARDRGTAVMTGKISLVAAHKGQPAFIIYKAVYGQDQPAATAASRQAALYGYVFSAVNVADTLGSISGELQNPAYAFQLFDGSTQNPKMLLYQTSNFPTVSTYPAKVGTFNLVIDAHQWNIKLVAAPSILSSSERTQPLLEFIRGIIATVLLAGILWYIITNRERKLVRMRHEAVQATKDDILTLASHQLRTPATIVKQHLGILLQNYGGKITKRQREILNVAYAGNQRQLEIINQFLDVARLDYGRLKLRKESVNIDTLLGNVVSMEREVAVKRNQKIMYSSPKKAIQVKADPHYLRMALENLVGNASKYTPEKGRIIVKARRYKQNLLIEVSDNGIGISKPELDSIFDKFTRIESEYTTDANGSGVGLYFTKQIILLHGGDIEVESTPGKGSTFIIKLPLDK